MVSSIGEILLRPASKRVIPLNLIDFFSLFFFFVIGSLNCFPNSEVQPPELTVADMSLSTLFLHELHHRHVSRLSLFDIGIRSIPVIQNLPMKNCCLSKGIVRECQGEAVTREFRFERIFLD